MSERVDPFAGVRAPLPAFTTKPKKEAPVPEEAIARLSNENGFPSRQPRKASKPRREPRVYRTGRNRHFGIKATNEAVERFYKAADQRGVALGRLLELALDALDAHEAKEEGA